MEGSFFDKYRTLISQKDIKKEEVASLIHETTGVLLDKQKIHLQGNKVKLSLSSTERSILNKKKLHDILSKKGYVVEP